MAGSTNPSPEAFQGVLKTLFDKDDLRYAKNGFKLSEDANGLPGLGSAGELDLVKGAWKKSGALNKPQRWLFRLREDPPGTLAAEPAYPDAHAAALISYDKGPAAVLFRILPLFEMQPSVFSRCDGLDLHVLMVFDGPLPEGNGSEPLVFDPTTGDAAYKGQSVDYVFAAVLGVRPRTDAVVVDETSGHSVRYGDVADTIAASIPYAPNSTPQGSFPVYDLTESNSFLAARQAVTTAWQSANKSRTAAKVGATPVSASKEGEQRRPTLPSDLTIPPHPDLIGIPPSVYRQVDMAIAAGKRHIILFGPPGTGKTSLAQWIADHLVEDATVEMITGSADWTSQDIIGGYQTLGEGRVGFIPGVLLQNFDRPIVIDELNRAEIDKAIGPLFSVLSGQPATLQYRTEISEGSSAQYRILPQPKAEPEKHEFAPGEAWRIIATMNTVDRAVLRSFSYALSRRFAWIAVEAPENPKDFIREYLTVMVEGWSGPSGTSECPLSDLWDAVNDIRPLGAAPFVDIIKLVVREHGADALWGAPSSNVKEQMLDGIEMFLMPMLDGIEEDRAGAIFECLGKSFALDPTDVERIRRLLRDDAF